MFVSEGPFQSQTGNGTRFGQSGTTLPVNAHGQRRAHHTHPLEEELRRTLQQVKSLAEDNYDLRKSAEIWIRMYEGQLARAERMAAELERATAPGIGPRAARGPARD